MRLTKNGKYENYEPIKPSNLYPAIDKLGKLEDIEEEIGIDLITIYNVSKYGFYKIIQTNTDEILVDGNKWWPNEFIINLQEKCFVSITASNKLGHTKFYFKDNGITWTLAKEVLEKDEKV